MAIEERKRRPEGSDRFISIDIASLSRFVTASASSPVSDAGEEDRIVGARAPVPFKKALSKKGWQRDGETAEFRSVAAGGEKADVDSDTLLTVKIPTADTGASNGCRHLSGRRLSWWQHPRRVLVLFASLSSMGTLILLYLTLSTAGHADA